MGNFNSQELTKIKAEAEKIYASIKTVYCPALQAEVHFSSEGFIHIQFDGTRNKRPPNIQQARFECLAEAVDIIRRTSTIQEYRVAYQPIGRLNANGVRQIQQVEYYAFQAMPDLTKPRRVNAVVRRINGANFHFWSVIPAIKDESKRGLWILDP